MLTKILIAVYLTIYYNIDRWKESLASKLYPCLDQPNKIPCRNLYIKGSNNSSEPQIEEISTAEAGTIQLEFRAVSRATNDIKYEVAYQDIHYSSFFVCFFLYGSFWLVVCYLISLCTSKLCCSYIVNKRVEARMFTHSMKRQNDTLQYRFHV